MRPIVSAKRNFLTGYCIAPAANRNGTMGMGGGSNAGMAIAPKPHFSKGGTNPIHFLSREPVFERRFSPFRASRYET